MRDVQAGDVILHLTDNLGFTGVSRAASGSEEFGGLPGTDWEGECYLIRLQDFVALDPPLTRSIFFSTPYKERLVGLIGAGMKNLFYNREPNLNQGAYLTPAPPELVEVLDDAYQATSGKHLPMRDAKRNTQVERVTDPPLPTLEDLAAATYLDIAELQEIESLLEEKQQLVFEGPPGSGKTFVAKLFARYFTGNSLDGIEPPDERVELVQFHQAYGYEDFVQGIRPVTDEHGRLQYHVLPGTFMRLCDLAARNPKQRFVLVIDEINRGNLSRIFGELLLLLEYRNERVRLPYGSADGAADQAFLTIPENLYLIGTMNSTDRSLALIDYALRRRFYFYAFRPVEGPRAPVLEGWLADQDMPDTERQRVGRLFVELNRKVQKDLSADFQIGHSYFMTRDIGTAAGRDRVWKRAVRPLLAEYFHNQRDPEAALAGFEPEKLLAEVGAPITEPDQV
jgi:DNA polymerase III delta prime subunit